MSQLNSIIAVPRQEEKEAGETKNEKYITPY